MTVTDSDIDTQIALQDFRQRVLNRQPIQAHEYRAIMNQLQRNVASRAAAMSSASRKAKKATSAESAKPVNLLELFGPKS
jgi:predicted metal-dependent RNase